MADDRAEVRYASVGALDDDLRRWLECRPVAAMGDDWTLPQLEARSATSVARRGRFACDW